MLRRLAAPLSVAAALLVGGALTLTPRPSAAFCGFYVAGADAHLYNNATSVVLMRSGKRTVLSMQNDYQGPPEDFALVIPVPVILKEADVKVLRRELFKRVETLAAPRLVEYWEQDPCMQEGTIGLGNTGLIGRGGGGGTGSGYGRGAAPVVVVEAEFAVGEYEIVILSATESNGLDSWLRTNGYRIPAGAEPLLRPYVTQGMKFFVAKVNPKKVKFDKQGRAELSPLRFHYDSDEFALPIRLGLINAPDPKAGGKQDLLVHVLAPHQRYEVANYLNVTIPTNLDVDDAVRERFGEFYVSLFDHTLGQNPGAVVTEYAWGATNCDPCPGPDAALTEKELAELGADVIDGQGASASAAAPTRMTPVVRQGKAQVKGPLSPDIIRRIVRAHINEIRRCYALGLVKDPKLAGEVELHFEIDAEGRVREATLGRSTVTDEGVGRCSVAALKRWKFPKPQGGAKVEVQYPLHLQGQVAASGSFGGFGGFGGSPSPYVLTRLHARYDA
ncbi:MAG: TonB family protein, partial [Myxococcales bacterium]|nr:TonB family protein [Myxococcales bacterium]